MVLTQLRGKACTKYNWVRFPYHYGSHATVLPFKAELVAHLSFHTTMVLTQHAQTKCFSPLAFEVSIPLWFSRNIYAWATGPASRLPFPYHYGSHATRAKSQRSFHNLEMFPYHYGSHATGSLPRNGGRVRRFHTTMVLTQLVGDSKHKMGEVTMFPYHYGSHATHPRGAKHSGTRYVSIPLWFSRNLYALIGATAALTSFHTTMVLTQQEGYIREAENGD